MFFLSLQRTVFIQQILYSKKKTNSNFKPGLAFSQINRNAVYVNKDQITGFWGNDLAICAKASSTLVDTTPV